MIYVFPTETVYGIGASVWDKEAIKRIFKIKGRPADNPLIVHISRIEHLEEIAWEVPEVAWKLIERYWPGPLTLVLKKHPALPYEVTGGRDTVAVRMPAHPVALLLIEKEGPIAAPSANLSGRPSITTYEHAVEELGDKVDVILKGKTTQGIESTVISLVGRPRLLRPGPITYEELKELLPELVVAKSKEAEAPGMKYPHYQPTHKLYLLTRPDGDFPEVKGAIWRKDIPLPRKLEKVFYYQNERELAQNLYYWIRELDKIGDMVVLGVPEKGLGFSIMNRLKKAAHAILQ
ncbi:MAG: threonylcarbamoyl-AMP synthase [Candidatus Micrarchaeota archaeon]|nr:threonylcarbamoyl-AMP synthase [Candidatus Micrarchaeota archaeon]